MTGHEPNFIAYGGYHDAGDADRRTYHMDVPCTLLTTYEAFPACFTDDQFNIPDKFDSQYNILGKGNKIPDILDEAEWGAMFWEYMQEPSGAIHWGTETQGYSPFTTYDKETKHFGTEVLDTRSAGFAAGMFLHLARIMKPYKPDRAEDWQKHADLAFKAAGDQIRPTHKLYYAVQKYLLTGDESAHQMVKDLADSAGAYAETYNGAPESFAGAGATVVETAGWPLSSSPTLLRRPGRPIRPWWNGSRRQSKRLRTERSNTSMPTPIRSARRRICAGGEATWPRDSMPILVSCSGP